MTDPHPPSLSVVIPTFNNVAVLEKCLESWQTFAADQPVELIVVEDGCRDSTAAYLAAQTESAWGRRFLRWFHEENVHELRSTNRGMREARAPLVMTWHDDMFLRRRWFVPELIATFERYPEIGLLCLSRGLNCIPCDDPIERWVDLIDWKRLQSTIGPRPMNWFRLQEVDAVIRPWVVRRACLDRVGVFDEAFVPTGWDEADLAFRVRQAGWKVATHGYERLGTFTHLGSSTFAKFVLNLERDLQNGRLFYGRWDASIRAEAGRPRATWPRPATPVAWIATLAQLARYIVSPPTKRPPILWRRRLKTVATRLLPEAIKARLRGPLHGHRPARVRVPVVIGEDARGPIATIDNRITIRFPKEERLVMDVHLVEQGAAVEEMYAFIGLAGSCHTFFDVGAASTIFSQIFCATGPEKQAVAYEPSPVRIKWAERLTAANGFESRIRLRQCLVSRTPGRSTGTVYQDGTLIAGEPEGGQTGADVEVTSLDRDVEVLGVVPDLIKIDVEGDELEVLRGARKLLHEHKPALCLEIHLDILERRGTPVRELVEELQLHKYRFRTCTGRELQPSQIFDSFHAVLRLVAS